MAVQKYQAKNLKAFGFGPALLRTESSRDFAKLDEEVNNDLQPQDRVHRVYVDDFTTVTWTIWRYQRAHAAITDNALEAALTNVLRPLLLGSRHSAKADRAVRDMAHGWVINDPEIRKRVSALLKEAGLGEWSIEGEALRLTLPEIQELDGMIAALEARRDNLLHKISRYDKRLAKNLKKSSDRLLKTDAIPSIVPSETEI